ncbi:hypothetical protein J6590_102564 [Homalodisca vitripennis]|nr:hypothetical protein J6590_102564 [Homalodisca vitripennis]
MLLGSRNGSYKDGKDKHQCAYVYCVVIVRLWRLCLGAEEHTAETHYVLNQTAVGPHAYRELMTGHRSSISYLEPLQLNLQLITRALSGMRGLLVRLGLFAFVLYWLSEKVQSVIWIPTEGCGMIHI